MRYFLADVTTAAKAAALVTVVLTAVTRLCWRRRKDLEEL